ncbi:hypothetical protein RB195_011277 [Necator americanus]|uniref:Sec20 C-terminal domain-containing protein n=1 Tax=Necator americanus TaxID=51031 RepID=A0ABR1D1V6_NECAM
MPPISDRGALEAHILHQEIVKLDTMAKQKIDYIMQSVRDEKTLYEETREAKDLLTSLKNKIDALKTVTLKLSSRREQQNVRDNAERHSKELTENQQQLRTATIHARKTINESARSSLFESTSDGPERKKRQMGEKNLKEDAMKTTERLSELLSRMGEQVTQSEQTMDSLVHSSSVLAQTHKEFESHAGYIQTGSKLLSKYERRELTDKILVTIALIFYLAVIYYILQKRVLSKFWLCSWFIVMEIDKSPVKMEDMVREYAELLRKSNDEDAKRMVVRVEGILEATDDSGRSTPHFAAVGGCMPILQLAISQDKMAANRTDDLSFGLVLFYIYPAKINSEMGWTPLMIAASAGRVEVVRYLLSLPQVDVNHRNNNLQTALHYAASRNHAEITHLLLEAGSDVNAADKFGATPLHRAASQGHDKIVHMLLGRAKIHIDARNSEGNTPLFLACEEDREDAAIALARKGASLTVKNKEEQTPLDVVKTSDLRMKLRKAEQHAQAMQQ